MGKVLHGLLGRKPNTLSFEVRESQHQRTLILWKSLTRTSGRSMLWDGAQRFLGFILILSNGNSDFPGNLPTWAPMEPIASSLCALTPR